MSELLKPKDLIRKTGKVTQRALLIGTLAFGGAASISASTHEGNSPTPTPQTEGLSPEDELYERMGIPPDREVIVDIDEENNVFCAKTKLGKGGQAQCGRLDEGLMLVLKDRADTDEIPGPDIFAITVVDPQRRLGGMLVKFDNAIPISSPAQEDGLLVHEVLETKPKEYVVVSKDDGKILLEAEYSEPLSPTEPYDEDPDTGLPITNDFVEGANDYDHEKVKKDACEAEAELSEEFKDIPNPNPNSDCPTPTP